MLDSGVFIGDGTYVCEVTGVDGCTATGSIQVISGSTDPQADNYDSTANFDDGSSLYGGCPPNPVYGCTDPTQFNYDSSATCDDGSCQPYTTGCTDPLAMNYNPSVNTDDGSCLYCSLDNIWTGSTGTVIGSCVYTTGCSLDVANISGTQVGGVFASGETTGYGNVTADSYGSCGSTACCTRSLTDPSGNEVFNITSGTPNGSGCGGSFGFGYGWNSSNGSGVYTYCIQENACNLGVGITSQDSSVLVGLPVCQTIQLNLGCTDPAATNTNSNANINDGTCTY